MRKLLRLHHWWAGKIPPAIAVAYLALAGSASALDVVAAARNVALFLVSCLGIGGLGYLMTDAFDVEEDRRIGKPNGWSSMQARLRVPVVALLLAAAWLPWRWLPNARIAAVLVALEMGLFALYAIPPIRLKARGMAGIVTDALYAHVLPTMVAWVAFSKLSLGAEWTTPLLLATWMLLMGTRHLARHQHDDLDRDRLAGLTSFAARRGRDGTMRFLVRRLLPLEALVALLSLLTLATSAPLLLAGFVAHAFWELHVVRRRWLAPLPPFAAMSECERHDLYAQRLLSAFVERWMAPLALVSLVLRDGRAVWLVPLHLLMLGAPLREWWHTMRALPRFVSDPPPSPA
ncbi:MAG: UbiA family prenyltransferase [Gemmatimonadaceae bacterium]